MNEDHPKTWTWDEYVDSERGRLDYALDEIKHLKEQIDRLKAGCAWAYQLAGAVGADVQALDNLEALADGKVPPHEWPYPIEWEVNDLKSTILGLIDRLDEVGTRPARRAGRRRGTDNHRVADRYGEFK